MRGKKGSNNDRSAAKSEALATRVDKLLRKIPKGTFSTVGGMIGGAPGAAIGSAISQVTGYGSYKVKHNTVGDTTVYGADAANVPGFSNFEHGTRIKHREFVKNIVVPSDPTAFNVEVMRLGLDNSELFPWLSLLATRFQKYKVHGMMFYFRSTSTDYNNSGSLAFSLNYDVTENGPTQMSDVLNSFFATSSKPSQSFAAPVECDPATMPSGGYYIRHPNASTGTVDLRMSQVGSLNVCTEGLSLSAGQVLGQLWCTYDIELLYPITDITSGIADLKDEFVLATSDFSDSSIGAWNSTLATGAGPQFQVASAAGSVNPAVKQLRTLSWSRGGALVGKTFWVSHCVITGSATAFPSGTAVPAFGSGCTVNYTRHFLHGNASFITRLRFTITDESGYVTLPSYDLEAAVARDSTLCVAGLSNF